MLPLVQVLTTVDNTTVSRAAVLCFKTPFCVAFDTKGNLWTKINNATLTQAAQVCGIA